MSENRRGVLFGALAYALWGVFPLYFPLLVPSGPGEILAHRILWSLLVGFALLVGLRRLTRMWSLSGRERAILSLAAVLLSINWLTYVYGVLAEQVVQTSLGYFINPLVTVALGVLVLNERLDRVQWVAITIACLAVVVLTVSYGGIPWIALTLAFSFGGYGLCKKQADVPAFESLAFETMVLALPAVGFVGWLAVTGGATFGTEGWLHALLLTGLGVVTALPLLLFGAAATRIPLVTLGLLQYLAPTLQLLIGVVVLKEPMPPARWLGFALVWLALVIFTTHWIHRERKGSRDDAVTVLSELEEPTGAVSALPPMTSRSADAPPTSQ